MGINPKQIIKPRPDYRDDVEAILQLGKETLPTRSDKRSYTRRSHTGSVYDTNEKPRGEGFSLGSSIDSNFIRHTSHKSKIAILLEKADEKGWGDSVRQRFIKSRKDAILFKGMRIVKKDEKDKNTTCTRSRSRSRSRPNSRSNSRSNSTSSLKAESKENSSSYDADTRYSDDEKSYSSGRKESKKKKKHVRESTKRLSRTDGGLQRSKYICPNCGVKKPQQEEELYNEEQAKGGYGKNKKHKFPGKCTYCNIGYVNIHNHSRLDDAKHCTFVPRIDTKFSKERRRQQRNMNDTEKKEAERFNFLNRQEQLKRAQKDTLASRIGEAEYQAKIDKKICSECKKAQTYDEWKEKRKKCPNCDKPYINSVQWAQRCDGFFDNSKTFEKMKAEKLKALRQSLEENDQYKVKKVWDPRTKRTIEIKEKQIAKKLDAYGNKVFLARMENQMMESKARQEQLTASHQYPFQPNVNSRSSKGTINDFLKREEERRFNTTR